MNRIITFLGVALIVTMSASAFAQYSYDRSDNDSSYERNDNDSSYESSFGTRYEYDLSDPGDRIMYDVDPAAQLRDSIDVNPTRELERGIGEHGGGVLDDDDDF